MKILEIETSFGQQAFDKLLKRNQEFNAKGWNYCVCVDDSFFLDKLSKAGIKSYSFSEFLDPSELYKYPGSISDVNGQEGLSDYVKAHRFYNHDFFKVDKDLNLIYREWVKFAKIIAEKILTKENPDVVLQTQGAEIIRLVFEEETRRRGIPCFYEGFSPFCGRKSYYSSRFADNWLVKEPETDDYQRAEEWVQTIKDKGLCWSKAISKERDQTKRFRNVKRYISKQHSVFSKNAPSAIIKSFINSRKDKFLRNLWYSLRTTRQNLYQHDFLFFPLHLPYESQVTVRSNHLIIQSALVGLISTMLPDNLYLLVKEHPDNVGKLPSWELGYLRRFPNVLICPPKVHPHDIIKRCSGIITINSTAGFEGILFDKPVFVLGKAFYAKQGVTIDIENITDLHSKLRDNLSDFRVETKTKKYFLAKVVANSYENPTDFLSEFALLSRAQKDSDSPI